MGEEDSPRTNASDETTEGGSEAKGSVFRSVFARYRRNITALREFFMRLNPVVADIEVGITDEYASRLDRLLSDFRTRAGPEDMRELRQLIDWLSPVPQGEPCPSTTRLKSPAVGWLFYSILGEFERASSFGAHRVLLNASILISLVGYFELLVADLVHTFYRTFPEAAANDDKVLSVNQLKSFDSIDEAIDYVVSRRVDDLLRGTLEEWHKFFESRLKIDLRKVVPEWARFSEIIQRRHLIVHAGGEVNRRYLANVDWERLGDPDGPPALGTQLSVDEAYLNCALDIFEVAGVLLCQSVWKKLAPEETDTRLGMLGGLGDVVYRSLLGGRWYIAERLCGWGLQDKRASEHTRLVFKFNRWLAIKRQGRWEEIASEVECLDCSAIQPKFLLSRASLMERADEFFEILPAALNAGVSLEDLQAWPILDEMREDPRFQDAISKAERNSDAVSDIA